MRQYQENEIIGLNHQKRRNAEIVCYTIKSILYSLFRASLFYINKIQQMQVFITANLLYMFRASIDTIIRSTSNSNHSLWYRSLPCNYDLYQRLWLQFYVHLMMGAMDNRNI